MDEKNRQCAFCKAILFEDDDVVHCPVCGAAHHHECYNSCGHCALEQFHGTDEQFDPHPEDKQNGDVPLDREGHTCRRCGKISSSDTIFCPYCGTLFRDSAVNSRQDEQSGTTDGELRRHEINIDLLGGIDKNTEIDGLKAVEAANHVRFNTRRYIPLFASMSEHKTRKNWNWAAFLLPAAWNAYRKNYVIAAVYTSICISAFILVSSIVTATNAYLSQLPVDALNSLDVLWDAFATVGPMHWVLFGVGIALDLVSRLICGLYGDSWYKSRVYEKIKSIKENPDLENDEEIEEEIKYRGGVNQWLGFLLLMPSAMMLYQSVTLLIQVLSWLMGGMMG